MLVGKTVGPLKTRHQLYDSQFYLLTTSLVSLTRGLYLDGQNLSVGGLAAHQVKARLCFPLTTTIILYVPCHPSGKEV